MFCAQGSAGLPKRQRQGHRGESVAALGRALQAGVTEQEKWTWALLERLNATDMC